MPATGEAFTNAAADTFWAVYNVFFKRSMQSKPDDSGYTIAPHDRETIDALADGIYWEIRNAETRFNAERRHSRVNEAKAKAAKADLPLQTFLKSIRASDKTAN